MTVSNVKVLGTGCAKCLQLEQAAREAIGRLGLAATLEKVTDPGEIASWGVMATPALVVDDEVVSSGRVLSASDVAALLSR